MMTVEVFARPGALHQEQREELGNRLLHELMAEEGAPAVVLDAARALTNVIVHEPGTWVTNGDGPRYVVRLTVPGSWNTKDFAAHMIPKVTAVIAAVAEHGERLLREPHCQVQIVGLKEHAVGTLGRAMTATDITRLMTDGYRASGEPTPAPPGTAVDPVCGMAVDMATATITLEHGGTRYAFCAPVCRKVFVEELAR